MALYKTQKFNEMDRLMRLFSNHNAAKGQVLNVMSAVSTYGEQAGPRQLGFKW